MKPYDEFNNVTVEIYAYDTDRPEKLVWRCTEEEGKDFEEIKRRVIGQGYTFFEKRIIFETAQLFEIKK